MLKQTGKRLLRLIFCDYGIYRIYACEADKEQQPIQPPQDSLQFIQVTADELKSRPDSLMTQQAWYLGGESIAYGCRDESGIVALCFFWYGERYRERNFWPLRPGEAKLVHIITSPERRGRGIASSLIAHAQRKMSSQGFHRLYARIWHNNVPSLLAFEKAGWRWIATVIEVRPMGLKHATRLVIPTLNVMKRISGLRRNARARRNAGARVRC